MGSISPNRLVRSFEREPNRDLVPLGDRVLDRHGRVWKRLVSALDMAAMSLEPPRLFRRERLVRQRIVIDDVPCDQLVEEIGPFPVERLFVLAPDDLCVLLQCGHGIPEGRTRRL